MSATFEADALAAFRQRLLTVPGLPSQIEWSDRVLDPDGATPFVREMLSATGIAPGGIGKGGVVNLVGFYAVDLMFPIIRGAYDGSRMAALSDAVVQVFKIGATVMAGDVPVIVEGVTGTGPITDGIYGQRTVTIYWRSNRANN